MADPNKTTLCREKVNLQLVLFRDVTIFESAQR